MSVLRAEKQQHKTSLQSVAYYIRPLLRFKIFPNSQPEMCVKWQGRTSHMKLLSSFVLISLVLTILPENGP